MTEHTPGPWKYAPGPTMVFNSDGQMVVAEIRGWGTLKTEHGTSEAVKIQDANGALIAAAPELLEACLAFVGAVDPDGINLAFVMAKTAIRKATQSSGEER